jgi:hypothetical protein
LYGDALYFLRHYQGILTRVDSMTGEERPGAMRLPAIRDVYASPVGAAGRVYVTSREGITVVLSHSDQPDVLAVNRLDDTYSASAVLVENDLILRGETFLYCLGRDVPEDPAK